MKIIELIQNRSHKTKYEAPCFLATFPLIYKGNNNGSCHMNYYPYSTQGGCIGCRHSDTKDWVRIK